MLINRNTKIFGTKVILVPYREEHVAKYHEWMQSKELQQLTASVPLTLDEEYEMQKSWSIDNDKLTFIVLDKRKYEETHNEVSAMIGDTNLFFVAMEEGSINLIAEAEIMIAEEWARGSHCGSEAMMLMLQYGINKLKVQHFVVKISTDNEISLHLFKNLGFAETSTCKVFNEITLELLVNNAVLQSLKERTPGAIVEDNEEFL